MWMQKVTLQHSPEDSISKVIVRCSGLGALGDSTKDAGSSQEERQWSDLRMWN